MLDTVRSWFFRSKDVTLSVGTRVQTPHGRAFVAGGALNVVLDLTDPNANETIRNNGLGFTVPLNQVKPVRTSLLGPF